VILFSASGDSPILRISAEGGVPVAATVLDTARHEVGHRFPRFLPDGTRFFYATTPVVGNEHEIYLARVGSLERRLALRCDGIPELTTEGWLLYRKTGLVYAQRFDAQACRLSGEPQSVAMASQGVGLMASPTTWSSGGRMLAYVVEPPRNERLAWLDRQGREDYLGFDAGGWLAPSISPDGARAVVVRYTLGSNTSSGIDLWMLDLRRERGSRFTSDPDIEETPVWSPDGRRVLFDSNRSGRYELFLKSAEGGDAQGIARTGGFVMRAHSWAPDGRWVVYEVEGEKTSLDLWLLSMGSDREQRPLLESAASESEGRISPDGRTLVYVSDESGRSEIYSQSFPGPGGKTQVSFAGGLSPRWRADGRELFFRGTEGSVFAVAVEPGAPASFSAPQRLFRPRFLDSGFDVAPDGSRFLMCLTGQEVTSLAPTVIVNWTAKLK